MKRILYITAFPPNNKTAGQNYSLHLLQDLCKYYEIDLVYWSYRGHSPCLDNCQITNVYKCVPNSKWKIFCYIIIFRLFPLFVVRFNWKMLRILKKNAGKYDFLYFDFSQTFIYSLFIKHPRKIMMCHDVIAQKYRRTYLSFLYYWLVRFSEKKLLRTGWIILTFSRKDSGIISSLYGLTATVVPFYIDDKISQINLSSISIKPFFIFYGAWNRYENLEGLRWFLQKVLPKLNTKYSFKIIGGGLRDRNVLELIKHLGQQVEYLGFVENPYLVISEAQALIAPLFNGAGVKVKVVESMALGVPVIGTDIAFEGIDNISVNGKSALTFFSSASELANIVNKFQEYSLVERLFIQNTFLRVYSDTRFIYLLRENKL